MGEVDVLHRAKDNRDAQRQNRHRQHLVIQLSPGYMPEQAPDKEEIHRRHRQDEERVIHQVVVQVEPGAPAVVPAQGLPAAPDNQVQLVAQVLGRVGRAGAEQDGGEGLIKAQPEVGRGGGKQEHVDGDASQGRPARGAVAERHAPRQRQHRRQPAQRPEPEPWGPVQPPGGEGVKHIELEQEFQHDFLVDPLNLSHGFRPPPPRTSW